MRKLFSRVASVVSAAALTIGLGTAATSAANAASVWQPEGVAWSAPSEGGIDVYRLYNKATGLHLYSSSEQERNILVKNANWSNEGVAFKADTSGQAVYRLYNKATSRHHLTFNADELANLVRHGWINEGIAWYVGDNADVKVYRLYNPKLNEHLWTTDIHEYNDLGQLVEPEPTPDPDPNPDMQQGIIPGAFCSSHWAKGVSRTNGKIYTCKPADKGNSWHWRP